MKTDTLLILTAAGAALYLLKGMMNPRTSSGVRPGVGQGGTTTALNNGGTLYPTEIGNTALPGDNGWGWKYYSDGTAIDPAGNYYLNGQLIYSGAPGQMNVLN